MNLSCLIKYSVAVVVITVLNKEYCEAKKGFGPGSQDYGYVEVRKGAHMFYWLYYRNTVARQQASKYPLIIWLQGGPGASSTAYGNFGEFGTLDTKLNKRDAAWTKHVNVLFIDNPVGAGFSYVENSSLYVKNNTEISKDLVKFTKSFFKKFKKFSKTPLYIFCESYGGKMAVQFAYDLYKEIKMHNLKINFKGVALGDSWISPLDSCLTWAPYLLNTGIVDTAGYEKIDKVAQELKSLIESEKWIDATSKWGDLETVIWDVTYHVSFYNILYGDIDDENDYKDGNAINITQLLQNNDNTSLNKTLEATDRNMRYRYQSNRAMEIGSWRSIVLNSNDKNYINKMLKADDVINNENGLASIMDKVKDALKSVIPTEVKHGSQSGNVFDKLKEDFMKPVTKYVEKLLNETDLQVVVYSGQLDLIVDTPGTLNWVDRLEWPGSEKWRTATRSQLVLPSTGKEEGFIKKYDKFTFYWINRAGHMVPADNPYGSLEVLRQITHFDKK